MGARGAPSEDRLVLLVLLGIIAAGNALRFLEVPPNVTAAVGQRVVLRCRVSAVGRDPPELGWWRRRRPFNMADVDLAQVPLGDLQWVATTHLRLSSVQPSDVGPYQCWARDGAEHLLSHEAHLELEGLPIFLEEPQDLQVGVLTPFNLSCGARGPPEPVRLLWTQDGVPLNQLGDPLSTPPSVLRVSGLNRSASFSCEAHNERGVTASRSAAVTVVPQPPRNLMVVGRGEGWLQLTWEGGISGESPVRHCTVQAVPEPSGSPPAVVDLGVPPFSLRLEGLLPHSPYSARVSCGGSAWSAWLRHRPEDVPPETETESGALGAVGRWGPWGSPPGWGAAVGAVAVIVTSAMAVGAFAALRRHKETHYGEGFSPSVSFHVRSSFRRSTDSALTALAVNDDLKSKLRDVLIDRRRVSLGKTLGEGEFGSVVEGRLHHDENRVLHVAVKTMKINICSRGELEDFLSEAVCMKDFDHPNVMKLIGVCLQGWGPGGFPTPAVLLPFMKNGDLHSFLLRSRLGGSDPALPPPTLLGFLVDVAAGMSYLSQRNFVHRDLAARNCVLDDRLRVLVADFGLAKRVGGDDFYRQRRGSRVPVKWAAPESLCHRLYSTKSDVWSFGVLSWEVFSGGRTPYPGVDNSEIYELLRSGRRLPPPPHCTPKLYSLMLRCWSEDPRERPSFEELWGSLGGVLRGTPPPSPPLYVNMDERGASGGVPPPKNEGEPQNEAERGPERYVVCPSPPPENGDPPEEEV
ncbi:tyrosine-protein kinase receptor UFO [Cuculus canorus]|uniref:tyrosine-protein kinase receptor UFO n=1 Tax=Cuculus canorus TaxID=55661 RepID=UPI0023AADE6A|nr:tyrosine-protein kinase receptor UFO [Cuculus canorus]